MNHLERRCRVAVLRMCADASRGSANGPKITIGVCVKNGAADIGKAITSIMEQDFPHENIEVIFVDDGSEDDTLSVIQSYLPKLDMQVKLFHQKWKGLGQSRDTIVDCATGKYIIWVDSDMTLTKDFVTRQAEFMELNSDVAVGKGQYGLCPQKNLVSYLENIEFVASHVRRREKPNLLPLGTGGSIYRVEAIRQVDGFDPNIKGSGEDTDAEFRLRKAGWKLEATAPVFYEKRRGTWKSLWIEYFWFGQSGSNLSESERQIVGAYRFWPPFMLFVEVSRVVTAYQLSRCKLVFLMPLHFVFKRVAWSLGMLKLVFGKLRM